MDHVAEVGLAGGVLGVVLLLTYAIGLPLARVLEYRAVRPIADGTAGLLGDGPEWVRGLLVDGAIRGMGTVVTLVPLLVVVFAAIGVVEQAVGLTRVTMVAQRMTDRVGLSGAVVLPLCFGLACNVPAIIALRGVPSTRERLAATLLAPLVPCSARIAVLALLCPMFFPNAALLVALGLVFTNLVLFAVGGWCLLVRTSVQPDTGCCAARSGGLRRPGLRLTVNSMAQSLGSFVVSAGSIVLALSALTGLLGSLPGGGVERSVLAGFGRMLEPVGQVAGLGDWRFIVALLSSVVTRETGVAVLSVVFGAGSEGAGLQEALAVVSPASALAYLVIQMLFVPCVPTLWVMARETGSWRWPLVSATGMLVVSLATGALAYQVGRLLS